MRPLFTVVSRVHASTATGVANFTAGEFPKHKHTPDCEHHYSAKPNITTLHTHNLTSEANGHAPQGKDDAAKTTGNPSPYPGFNASAYAHPHAIQAHNHTKEDCNHPSHHNNTATSATYDKIIHPTMLNARADSSRNSPGHYIGTRTHHGGDEKSLIPRVDVTVCLGADCKDSKVVTANVNSAGDLTGVDAKDSKGMVKRQDTEISYEEVARQMSGAGIAGGT